MVRRNRRRSNRKHSRAPFWVAALALGALLAALSSCPRKPKDGEPRGKSKAVTAKKQAPKVDPALADIPLDRSVPEDRNKLPRAPATAPLRVAVHYILVKYKGAKNASGARWGKETAGRRAQRLMRAATQKGADFLALARRFSEVPEGEREQQLIFNRGQMDKGYERFEKAAFGMRLGQVSDAILTPAGFYVLSRVRPAEYSTAHVLVQYKGAMTAPPAVTRTKAAAKKKAEMVLKSALKGTRFPVLAGRYSDSPSRIRGGVIRPVRPGVNEKGEEVAIMEDGSMNPNLASYAKAASRLKVGEVSPVVESPYGFHVIKRIRLSWIQASHILVAYTGNEEVEPEERRSKSEAKKLARKISKLARAAKADFGALARKYSDDNQTADKGGDLGLFARGMKVPRLEQIAFVLARGKVSDVVETRYGYHVVKRTE